MRQKKRKKCRGCSYDECIPSKARSNAAIQSEVSAKLSEKTDETEEEKEM
jgi:hypothetical protein